MHHYPFHPGDYLKDTAHWSEARELVQVEAGLLRDLAYRRLLDLYYGEEEPIPSKTRLVAIRIRMLKHEEIVASVLKEKFSLIDGFWRQKRVDETVAQYQRRAAASRENGRKGGRPKTKREPTENLAGSGQVATKNHKPRTKHIPPTPQMGEWFEEWYAEFPNKKARQDALKAFLRLLPDRPQVEMLLAALRAQKAAGHFLNASGVEVWPNPATWINGRRWEDTIQAKRGDGAGKPWWDSRSGIMAKGKELGLPMPPEGDDMAWFRFMAQVWLKLGAGEWIDERSRAYPIYKQLRDEGGGE